MDIRLFLGKSAYGDICKSPLLKMILLMSFLSFLKDSTLKKLKLDGFFVYKYSLYIKDGCSHHDGSLYLSIFPFFFFFNSDVTSQMWI